MNKNLPLPLPSFRGRFFGNRYFCGIIMINSLMYSKRSTHPLTPLKFRGGQVKKVLKTK